MADFDLNEIEELDEAELRHRFERGDFITQDDIKVVSRILKKYEKERLFVESYQKASISSALVAQQRSLVANIIAVAALVVSIAGFIWQIY